jgi:hypothetical protein
MSGLIGVAVRSTTTVIAFRTMTAIFGWYGFPRTGGGPA